MDDGNVVTSDRELDAIYGEPVPRSLMKEIDHISDHYKAYVEAAPLVVMATVGPDGLDCSPRGDPAPIVRVRDPKTILLPDRRGNNRIDSLRNLVRDPRISFLFLLPGIDVTMRVNGRAQICTDPALIESFERYGKVPRTVIVTTVDRAYFQCPKALVRSRLWHEDSHIARSELPSTGEMMAALSREPFDASAYDAGYPEHMAKTIY